MTGNQLLTELYRGVMAPLRDVLAEYVEDVEVMRDDPRAPETADLVAALVAGDPDAAGAAMRRRMNRATLVLRMLLQAVVVDR